MKLKKILPIALSAMMVLSFSACNKTEQGQEGQVQEGQEGQVQEGQEGQENNDTDSSLVVATVGDQNITATEFKFYISMDKQTAEEEAGLTDKTADEISAYWATEEGKTKKEELIDSTLNNLKELKVLISDAEKEGIVLSDMEVQTIDQSIEDIIQTEGNGDKAAADTAMMEDCGVNMDQYKEMYTEYVRAYSSYLYARPSKFEISEEDIKKQFDENIDLYNRATVQHVLIMTVNPETYEPLAEEEIAQKKLLADEILAKAKAGEDFAQLVNQYTEDEASKDTSGEYTIYKNGEMVAAFEDWAFSAKEGDMGVVESEYGYHVMKFISSTPATLDDEIKATITSELQSTKFSEFIDKLIADSTVEKNQEAIDSLNLF